MLVSLVAYLLAAAVIVLLPGPDTLVIVRSIMAGGRRRGVAAVVGIQCGLLVWVTAAALGLAALLKASEIAFDVLRVAGAVYLVWLGVQSWRSRGTDDPSAAPRGGLLGTGFRGGLLSNLLNPKVGVFFVTFLPGFIPHDYPVGATSLLFGALFIALNASYQVPLVLLATKVTALMSRQVVRRRLERITGAVLIGFGIRLATEN
ncbi:LysE family translocator [uncultured Jatrophihabitans sp.]|uniref:LysE family translocator n=1 Tax=uncultured Jatrophihabitans sp. TaxID=1610747 RepID=UPI0035CA1C67